MITFNEIIILGSGFSKSICDFPTIKELTRDLKNMDPEFLDDNDPVFEELSSFFQTTFEKSNGMINSIEQILTILFSHSNAFDFKMVDDNDKIKKEILLWLYKKISQEKIFIKPEYRETLKKLIDFNCMSRDQKIKRRLLVSFNYDLIIEEVIKECFGDKISINYGLPIADYPDDELPVSSSSIIRDELKYLKLHGSLNWFYLPGASKSGTDSLYKVNEPQKKALFFDRVPEFIPMAHAKNHFLKGPLYSSLWKMADTYISKAEKIHIIGYGFPETDLNNLYYFLKYKDKIEKIVVYNDNKSDKLKKTFGEDKISSMDAMEYIKKLVAGK